MRLVRQARAFALYEVLIGLAIFVVGVLALGRAVENCMSASEVSEEENRVRQLLSNQMAEIQAAPVVPDTSRTMNINTGYGVVRLIQQAGPQEMKKNDNTELDGMSKVTLTAIWSHAGVQQKRQVIFYVYRAT
ncbi:MAG TPA: hypothetical protein VGG02_04465 [Chthoniobacterales bacterium]|jgi:hypothetical protein